MFNLFHLPPPNRARWKADHRAGADLNRQLWRLGIFLTGVIGLGALFQRIPMLVMKLDDARFATAIYLGILLALPVAGAMWGRQAWRTARLWQSTGAARNPLILRIAAILGLVGLAAFVFAHSFAAPTQIRVFHARQALSHYILTTDIAAGAVRIEGPIGPNLPAKLRAILSRTPSIRTIEITSASGLLEESLRVAAVIQSHPHLTVIARKTSNGPCVPILLAGTRRYADWDMDLGVDQVRAITAMPRAVDQNRVMQSAIDVDRYLANKGLPKNMRFFIRSADVQGLIREPAIRMTELRLLDGVMDGAQPISLTTAKWRAVEQSVQRSDQAGLQALLTAARDAGSTFVESHAEDLYAAFLTNDPARLQETVCGLAAPLAEQHVRPPAEPFCQ